MNMKEQMRKSDDENRRVEESKSKKKGGMPYTQKNCHVVCAGFVIFTDKY